MADKYAFMKNTHHNGPITHTATQVMHEAIATRAYELWLQDGQRENQSEVNWLEAECELVTGHKRVDPIRLPISF